MNADDLRAAIQKAAQEQAAQDTSAPKSLTPPDDDPARLWRWIALLGSGIADAESTRRALKRPGNYEANPAMAKIAGNTPLSFGVKLGVNGGMAALLDKTHKTNPKLANILAGVLAAVQGGVALRNTKVGKQ